MAPGCFLPGARTCQWAALQGLGVLVADCQVMASVTLPWGGPAVQVLWPQALCMSTQDLDEDDFDVGKPKKQRRSIVRTTSMTRVGGN